MNLTIKNLKISNFMSEETLCFQATVFVDGKKAGTAQNDGHGGSTYCHLDPAFRHLEDGKKYDLHCYCDGDDSDCFLCKGTGTYKGSFDELVDDEVHRINREKKDKAFEAKCIKKGATFVVHTKTQSIGFFHATEAEVRADIATKHPKDKIISIVALPQKPKTVNDLRNTRYENKMRKQGYTFVAYAGTTQFATKSKTEADARALILKHNPDKVIELVVAL